jgi:hypothetical protein
MQCEISCEAIGRRLDAPLLEGEHRIDPSIGTTDIVSSYLAEHPVVTGYTDTEKMESLVRWLYDQDFRQPALE